MQGSRSDGIYTFPGAEGGSHPSSLSKVFLIVS